MTRKILLTTSALLFAATSSFGVTLYWDGTDTTAAADGGSGSWNTVTLNWQTAASGGTATTYVPSSDVVFGGAAGRLTLLGGAGRDANSLRFSTAGYELTGTTDDNLTAGTVNLSGSGPAIVVDSGVAAKISALLNLSGPLAVSGGGDLTLTATNTFTSAIAINAATLQIGDSGSLGSGTYAGAIANDGKLTFATSAAQTLSGVISGAGGLSQVGAGVLTLTGNNTYTGNTTIGAGSELIVGATPVGGLLGAGNYAGDIFNDGRLTLVNQADQTLSGVISGAGSLLKSFAVGGVTLTGVNTFTGKIDLGSARKLTIGVSGSLGSGNYAGDISNAGTLTFATSAAQTLSGVISGTGTLTQSGTGTLTLTGANTYTGSTTVGTASNLKIEGSGSLGSGGTYSGAINNGGTLTFATSATQTLSGVISGAGTLTQSGTGTLILTRNNTYTGSTTVGTGSNLRIEGAGWLGPLLGHNYSAAINNGGTLTFATTAAQTLSGVISGAGTLTQSGTGTLTLTGNNTYTGSTTVGSGSALQVSGSGTLGNGAYSGTIGNAGNLTFATSATQILSGVISGGGTFTQSGTGILSLSGANTYTGTTSVNSGRLFLNGINIGGGAVSVASGAILGGRGSTVSEIKIAGGGTLLGGGGLDASGALSIGGNVTLASGSVIQLVLGASGTHSSLAGTGGTWTFDGTQKFSFLYAGAEVGTYAGLIKGISADPGTTAGWTITNADYAGTFQWNSGTNAIDLRLTAVPEPSTYGLIGAGTLAAMAIVRRRRRPVVVVAG